jgi:hypothetical protein
MGAPLDRLGGDDCGRLKNAALSGHGDEIAPFGGAPATCQIAAKRL